MLLRFAASVSDARARAPHVDVTLVAMDNSTESPPEAFADALTRACNGVRYIKTENIGYFPAFRVGGDTLGALAEFDCVAISNVDMRLDVTFFLRLAEVVQQLDANVGLIAPAIISRERGADANPKTLFRPTREKLKRNVFLFRHPRLLRIYQWMSLLKARTFPRMRAGMRFYSPHGSFVVFARSYFLRGASIDYPVFLFGEEDFVAEECRLAGLTVQYHPSIIVHDEDHGSTSKEGRERLAAWHVTALEYLIARYYPNP
jgi:GT2 family glycosyltransferase